MPTNMGEQFRGLPMGDLIGGPLMAACDAQVRLANATAQFIQQVGLADAVLLEPGFWESLWSDWSPGYQAGEDVAMLREHVTADTIGGVVGPYRASFNPQFADPNSTAEATATMGKPTVATYYLHGSDDGAIGSELLEKFAKDPAVHLPAAGSTFELIDGVGHFLHLERPEILAAKILAWLAV